VITLCAPGLAASEVANRVASRSGAIWLTSPGGTHSECQRQFVACDPVETVSGGTPEDLDAAWLRAQTRWRAVGEMPGPWLPVGMGYLGYDMAAPWMANSPDPRPSSDWPDNEVRFFDAVFVNALNLDGTNSCSIVAESETAARRLLERVTATGSFRGEPTQIGAFTPVDHPKDYLDGVIRIIRYLNAGDAYQVNLARRLQAVILSGSDRGVSLASRMASAAPAPHGIWMGWSDGRFLLGNSPERFFRMGPPGEGRLIETSPIKGTRPRGIQPDAVVAAELVGAKKDRAEHVMIVDLERNDLGRVCVTGSVQVVQEAELLTLPTVHHLESTVRGTVRTDATFPEIFRALFPGGSITGAPKRRAMQIIAELESARRGPYTGCTGWFGAQGDLDLAIAIRTAVGEGQRLILWVGAGIVVDSSPDSELVETEDKARAFMALAHGGGTSRDPRS